MTEVERRLATMARLEGIDPGQAIADFRHGGPLARLLRSFLADEPSRRPGPTADRVENWRRFVLVVSAKRMGMADAFVAAAELDGSTAEDTESRSPDRYRRTYFRMKNKGWRDEDVPAGLGAFFSLPPDGDITSP